MKKPLPDSPTQSLVDDVIDRLSDYDPYIHKFNRDSAYIHFNNLPRGMTHKLRISNHDERERYGYKWQLRLDGIPPAADRKQYVRYFDNVGHLVASFITYYTKVEENKSSDTGNTWA